MKRQKFLLAFAACLLFFFGEIHATAGPEGAGQGRPSPHSTMATSQRLGEVGPSAAEATVQREAAVRPVAASQPHTQASVHPAQKTQPSPHRDRKKVRPTDDTPRPRDGWLPWLAFGSGIASILAALAVVVVAFITWEFIGLLLMLMVLSGLLALVVGAFCLGRREMKSKEFGVSGFFMGMVTTGLPILLLFGFFIYEFFRYG